MLALKDKMAAAWPHRPAFTADMWTGGNGDAYLALSVHYIDGDFNQ